MATDRTLKGFHNTTDCYELTKTVIAFSFFEFFQILNMDLGTNIPHILLIMKLSDDHRHLPFTLRFFFFVYLIVTYSHFKLLLLINNQPFDV